MDALVAGLLAALAVLVVVHLAAERRASRWQLLTKGAASACFVALGLVAHAPWPVLAALGLAFAGDLLLVSRERAYFGLGIVAFLLAHVALIVAFRAMPQDPGRVKVAGVLALVVGAFVLFRLAPRLGSLRVPVAAYVLVISLMVTVAAGVTRPAWLLAPALAFYANDLLVARDRFVEKQFWHRVVGLPLYYGAMAAFAIS